MNDPKSIFIKNKYRDLFTKTNDYQTEHERLNREPEYYDVAKDFEYAKRHPIARPKQPPTVVSGNDSELSWLPKEELSNIPRPIETHTSDPNLDEFECNSIPSPNHKEDTKSISIDNISDGNYFIVISDEIIAEAFDLSSIEDLVEKIIFNNNNLSLDDIIVLRKMKIKVGVSVG